MRFSDYLRGGHKCWPKKSIGQYFRPPDMACAWGCAMFGKAGPTKWVVAHEVFPTLAGNCQSMIAPVGIPGDAAKYAIMVGNRVSIFTYVEALSDRTDLTIPQIADILENVPELQEC